jgi:dihydropteroate synthase
VTQIMGILNVTPDSFSDGGRFTDLDDAVAWGVRLRDEGASLVDVGGESTRPGADRVSPEQEQSRVIPVIRELVGAGVAVSVDTMNADTAYAAAKAGASVINDVSGGLADAGMYRVVAETGLYYVAMHWRGFSDSMDDLAQYDDVVTDVRNELKARVAEMTVVGIDLDKVILDPGLGFAKTAEHNWQLLGRFDELATLGFPLLVGASRKKFLKAFGEQPDERDEATAIVSALAAQAGAWGVRVHDVESTRRALEVQAAWQNGRS